ncbi:hypothetical protein GCK32_022840 [Trichostrongylus colubriformis]|uniref:Uncharacterized protein n=1 Tax=Trichostrongylus colubriformis TaxID=6319 RepID=A0AAN8FUA1_TRICO
MAPKVDRFSKNKETLGTFSEAFVVKQRDSNNSSVTPSVDVDYATLSATQLIKAVLERNSDPLIEKMQLVLAGKISKDVSEFLEADKRSRSIVISGIDDAPSHLLPSER